MIEDPSIQTLSQPPAVIVVTSAAAGDVPTDAIEGRSRLVRSVMRKPVDVSELARAIERLLGG
jgi:hypothetical protein